MFYLLTKKNLLFLSTFLNICTELSDKVRVSGLSCSSCSGRMNHKRLQVERMACQALGLAAHFQDVFQ
jgi:hypothetical protein